RDCVSEGLLAASHDYSDLSDADVVLVCVQTDKDGFKPDYGPLMGALEHLAEALSKKPPENIPIVCFESTLAPSTMSTIIRDLFGKYGLVEGKDVLLGNSPNRVMPGRLVERVAAADKIVAGLHPLTSKLIARLYERIVTKGKLHQTNSMTAEVVKTLENAYRDVRIAFATEIVRYCDERDIDFFRLRDLVNERLAQADSASHNATAVPVGGILVPFIGVGGHCLPKDGILLWWRKIEAGTDTSTSLILQSRLINDDSPAQTLRLAEASIGQLAGRRVALMGAAYRFDSEDTRNSPTLATAVQLRDKECSIRIHDPYVKPGDQNLVRFGLDEYFTNSIEEAVGNAEVCIFCTGHGVYDQDLEKIVAAAPRLEVVVDGANLFTAGRFENLKYAGIGRGTSEPSAELLDFAEQSFRVMEHGVANEVRSLAEFLNERFSSSRFNDVIFEEVQRLAATCATGCEISATKSPLEAPSIDGYQSHLARCAAAASKG
ncbi:MAG: nucleotide sugar dehydrogenase, partial [Planctomycetota bacterium]